MKIARQPHRSPTPHRPITGAVEPEFVPRATILGTVLLLIGLAATALAFGGLTPVQVARSAAIGVGLSLLASVACDARQGFRNLIRADLMALLALYFLTFFEFLFQQAHFDSMTEVALVRRAVTACLWGFAGIGIGRHLLHPRRQPLEKLLRTPAPPGWTVLIFWTCFFVGFLHMLVAVRFNIGEMLYYFMTPRFTQPWTRGQLGDWKALLVELGMLLYLIPPIAGIVLARWRNYRPITAWLLMAGFLFVLFYAFASGTRNLFASYLITFLIGYAFAMRQNRMRPIIIMSAICATLLLVSTVLMLNFRTIGLRNYLLGRDLDLETPEQSMFIDYNLYAICRVVEVFPRVQGYLGWEIPYMALIRPIPRAVWPGKPEGLSSTIEDALDAEGWTVATSFVGEAYLGGGFVMVFFAGLFFGVAAGWWGHLASPRNSDIGTLIYASGFFAAVISMRSLFVFTTALLPTVAGVAIGTVALRIIINQRRRRQALAARRKLFVSGARHKAIR